MPMHTDESRPSALNLLSLTNIASNSLADAANPANKSSFNISASTNLTTNNTLSPNKAPSVIKYTLTHAPPANTSSSKQSSTHTDQSSNVNGTMVTHTSSALNSYVPATLAFPEKSLTTLSLYTVLNTDTSLESVTPSEKQKPKKYIKTNTRKILSKFAFPYSKHFSGLKRAISANAKLTASLTLDSQTPLLTTTIIFPSTSALSSYNLAKHVASSSLQPSYIQKTPNRVLPTTNQNDRSFQHYQVNNFSSSM